MRHQADMAEATSRFLVANLPPCDPNIETARRLVSRISDDLRIMRIAQMALEWHSGTGAAATVQQVRGRRPCAG